VTRDPALVFSGGGSRGAYQAGCWKALHESGLRPGLLVGTSAGALNACLVAAGMPPEEMEGWWCRLRSRDLFRVRRDAWRWRRWMGLQDASRLRAILEAHLDLDAVRRSPVPLVVTAVDLEAGQEVAVEAPQLTVDHLMATCALLPGLPPVAVGGRLLADGGHWNAFPLRHAVERGHRRIVGVLHDPVEPHPEPAPERFTGLLRRLSDVAWHSQQLASLDRLRLRTRLPPGEPDRLEPFDLELHAPDPPLTNLILRFEPKEARALFAAGYGQTRRRLGRA
jgi:NTE family protein